MEQEIITSIDFGSRKLSAAMVTREKDDLDILGVKSYKSAGIEKGLITDIKKCRECVLTLLKELEEKTKRNIRGVSIGISSNKVRITETSIFIDLLEDKVTIQDIKRALNLGKKNIVVSTDELIADILINFYMLDGKVIHKDILSWKGKKLEVNLTLIVVEKKEIQKYYEIFKGTKYDIQFVKLNILSGKHVFLNEKNSIGDIVLVDIGAGTTDIALFNNGVPKIVDSIPIGGNNVTNDLAICGNFSFLEADNIKKIYSSNHKSLYKDDSFPDEIEVGTLKVSRKLFYEVVNARIEEILSHINIKLKNTGHYDRICSIILYGDGINYFEDISEIVDRILKIKTKVIRKNDLGIRNPENITSLAIAKEVYDRLNLLGDSNIVIANKNNEIDEINASNKKEHLHNNEGKNHILKKIKVFFDKIF